ncbi:MAG: HEPN domain-containing protein [Candidatus Atribacteria bacterium]|nr:HEPN domain-containing protein [Candidatus Atribacteria bacterium]MCD6349195.1 HEPN domain-containing protein [Candidatus Atribacteria bacterium]
MCFHSEQSAEKYLKAYLVYCNREIPRTHNIAELVYRCAEIEPEFRKLLDTDIPSLTSYAVAMRYPGEELFPHLEEARRAVKLAEEVKVFVLAVLAQKGFSLEGD